MECDDSATDDEATENEEEKTAVDVTSGSLVNKGIETECSQNDIRKKVMGCEVESLDSRDEASLKGVRCLAPYSGDDEYYEAVIDSIHNTSGGKREAVVTFIGYESEGSEVVPVTALRKIIGKQPDKHMTGKNGIPSSRKKKKGKLNASSVWHNRRLLNSGKSTNKSNSTVVVEEFEERNEGRMQCRPSKAKTKPARPCNASFNASFDDNNEFGDEMLADGFDDQDMERPSFTQPTQYPSVPLVLSKADAQPVTQVPATVNRYLRDYQRDGVRFLFQHFTENSGAILGDDMGLGKTVQVISFIAAVLGKTGTKADIFCKFMDRKNKGKQKENVSRKENGTFLIVTPGSVMYNWKEELETWGHFKTGLFHGTTKEDTLQRALRGRLDVVLTTYETMRNHLDDLNEVKWLAVIMDEVHRLKDRKAQRTIATKALSVKRRYGLTGTPLQNKLGEFWCVLDWANPGSLGKAKQFNREFGKPIREGQRYDATKRELALARKRLLVIFKPYAFEGDLSKITSPLESKDLQDKISNFFLRRTKDLIASQLPSKDELVVFCPLTSFQEDVYQTLLQNPDVELIRKKNFPCDCGSGVDRGKCCYMLSSNGEDIKTITMRFFQLLLKVANHAALLAPTVKQTLDQQEKAKDLCLHVFARYPEFSGCTELSSFELLSDPKYCGKMKVLEKLMGMFHDERSKVLLFSRSTQLLDILEEFVISKGLVYSRLDGGTKPADRTCLVRDFNLDPSISLCLISTKAGGLGLNFTGANVVIIFDPNWNPSSDLQAQDRAYRIGQRRDVRVYRLISSGTIEEMIYLRQVYKQQLANIAIKGSNERRYFTGVEGDKDRKGELFGLENLFSYRTEGASLSKDIVNRTQKLEAGYRVTNYEIVHEKKREDGLENEVTADPGVNQVEDEDPYNLEELASQFIDDDEQPLSNPCSVADKLGKDLNSTSDQMKGEGIDGRESLRVLDNETAALSDVEDILTGLKANSKSAAQKLMESSVNLASRRLMSFEDFFNSEDLVIEPNNHKRIKGGESGAGSDTENSESVIPPAAMEESSLSCKDEHIEPSSSNNCYTKIKKKARKNERKYTAESFDMIPPTASLNRRIKSGTISDGYKDDGEQSVRSEENLSEMTTSPSEEEDSDEGLFTRSKEKRKRKRKPAKVVVTETSKILKEGRSRLRRFPGKHAPAPNIEVDIKIVTPKRSRKDNTVEKILESCGVRYTHANKHIIGPSEAENHMSKQALQDVFELRQFSQQPANCFPALETSDESDDLGESSTDAKPKEKPREHPEVGANSANPPPLNRSLKTGRDVTVERIGNSTVFVGSTPRGIRRQHFREMSDHLGFSSEIDLAKAVVESSVTERQTMLKRFYVDKHPVLSGLSCFTTGPERSAVTADERHGLKHAKRSLERTRAHEGHEVRKKAKRNLRKHITKVKLPGKDATCEAKLERHDVHRLDDDDLQGGNQSCSKATFQEKHEENFKKSTHVTENKHPFNALNRIENGFSLVNSRNYITEARDLQLNQRHQLQAEDEIFSSSASEWNVEHAVEFQGSSADNSVISVSLLDEFLSTSSCRGCGKSDTVDKTEEKVTGCSDKKENKHGKKKAFKEKTSVLDEFI